MEYFSQLTHGADQFNGYKWNDRTLRVHIDRYPHKNISSNSKPSSPKQQSPVKEQGPLMVTVPQSDNPQLKTTPQVFVANVSSSIPAWPCSLTAS
jgi:hypothetical protein